MITSTKFKQKKNHFKYLQSTLVGQVFIKLNRSLKSSRRSDRTNGNSLKKTKLTKFNFKVFQKFQTYILISVVVILIGTLLLNVIQYFSIRPVEFNNSVISTQNNINGNQINIVYLGFEDKGDYMFLYNIVLQSLDTKTGRVKHLLIDPNFSYRIEGFTNTFTFKTMFNNLQVTNEEKLQKLLSSLNSFLGLRIDRYVAFKYSDMKAFIDKHNLQSKVIEDSFIGIKKSFSLGNTIKGPELNNYLFNEDDLVKADTKVFERFLTFLNNNIERNSNYFNMYKLFWKSSELVKIFYTNLNREEIFYISRIMVSADYPVESEFISTEGALKDPKSIDNGYLSDQVLVDEKVSRFFRDVEILKEQAKIEIYNGSGLSGLAFYYRRLYENSGSKVVKYGNYNQEREKTTVFITKTDVKSLRNTVDMIKRSFDFEVEVTTEGYNENYSGDIIIILGKDIGAN